MAFSARRSHALESYEAGHKKKKKKKKTHGTLFKNTFLILLIYLSGHDDTQAINMVYDTPGSCWQAVLPHQNSQLS